MRRKLKTFSVRGSRKLILLAVLIFGMGLATSMYAATDCGTDPCPGTLPNIWPERSAPLGDIIRILGWNLEPSTEYNIVFMGPDGTMESWETVITDVEGDLLKTPYSTLVPILPGVYQVNLYTPDWNGDLNAIPIATTTFLKW